MKKERPILFSAPMVQAILEGRKTQTRRIVKLKNGWASNGATIETLLTQTAVAEDACPHGRPGDSLWVRETWNFFDPEEIPKERHGSKAPFEGCQGNRSIHWVAAYAADGDLHHQHLGRSLWKPSIHMPRWASRIDLLIKSVRVEPLHAISEEDAAAEGVYSWANMNPLDISARLLFKDLWVKINGKESWDANPYVWVEQFERTRP